jgi:hypothetical protein
MIIKATESRSQRDDVKSILKSLSTSRRLRVLDIGGGAGSWLGNLVTHIVDLQSNPQAESLGIEVIIGDAHLASTFEAFDHNYFDFVSCTHTLEDVRDPGQVIDHINRIGKAGFIAVPNRHQEVSHLESPFWRGNFHHRWIFSLEAGKLVGAFKSGIVHSSSGNMIMWPLQTLSRAVGWKRLHNAVNNVRPRIETPWFKKSISRYSDLGLELSLLFTGSIEFSYFLNDMTENPGEMPLDHAKHLSMFLARDPGLNQKTKLEELESIIGTSINLET